MQYEGFRKIKEFRKILQAAANMEEARNRGTLEMEA